MSRLLSFMAMFCVWLKYVLKRYVVLNFGLQRDSVEMVEGSGVVAKWEVIK